MWILGEDVKPQKCKDCDYSDICSILEVPSEEACEAIRSCTKEFLYEKIWESLDEYVTKKRRINMKLWIDDVRPAPEGYTWIKSVNAAKRYISMASPYGVAELEISIDHDAGEYVNDGGDYIKLLDWLEETNHTPIIHIHSMNPVGIENMRRIIQRNGWEEV